MRQEITLGLEGEVDFKAIRSRGPGGQNVNKVSSAAIATWNFEASQLLSDQEKHLIRTKLLGYLNKDACLYVRSDEHRDLLQNKARCIEKLIELLSRAFHRDKPRKASKPTRGSKIRKREQKTRRSEIKKGRQKTWKD
ncbi:MAG: alternative ribosome rescue aminoacyl-tRNA hydrolase ArfB [Bdellovibrionota bacterium]